MLCAEIAACLAALPLQVLLYSSQPFGPSSMRELNSNRVSQLVQISGIITSASKPKVCHVLHACSCGWHVTFALQSYRQLLWMALSPWLLLFNCWYIQQCTR